MTLSPSRNRWFAGAVLIFALVTYAACAKNQKIAFVAPPPDENRGSGMTSDEYAQVYNSSKDELLRQTNTKISEAFRSGANAESAVLICQNVWTVKDDHYQVSKGFPESDDKLDAYGTFGWVASYVTFINDEFGLFNDYLAIVDVLPAERTAKELAMTQGLVVLYNSTSLNEMLRAAEAQGCSYEPLAEQLKRIEGIVNELTSAQLPALLTDLQSVGVSEMDSMRYALPFEVLSGRTVATQCLEIDERYEGHQDEAMLLSWCGFDALRWGDQTMARTYWDRAKLVRGNAGMASYATKQISNLP